MFLVHSISTWSPGVDRFPVPGESLVACGSMTSAGGKGANQATAALKAGANVHYIGKIGNDTFGHFARRHLKGVGFNAVTLLVAEEIPHRQCADLCRR